MIARLAHFWQVLIGPHLLWWMLWVGLAALTIALLVLMRTRWGQSQPLGKCLALSLLAHLLLAGYATTVQLYHNTVAVVGEQSLRITRVDGLDPTTSPDEDDSASPRTTKPWNRFESSAELDADQPELDQEATPEINPETELAERDTPVDDTPVADAPASEAPIREPDAQQLVDDVAPLVDEPAELAAEIETLPAEAEDVAAVEPTPVTAPAPERPSNDVADLVSSPQPPAAQLPVDPLLALDPLVPTHGFVAPDAIERLVEIDDARQQAPTTPPQPAPLAETPPPILPEQLAPAVRPHPSHSADVASTVPVSLDRADDPAPPAAVPEPYELRLSNRRQLAIANGGSAETEAAVDAALAWLARNQSSDGHWDANRFGAGREMKVGGEDRRGAGSGADTGVTGLALLAMLGAGNTQLQGEHRECVRKGLEYLLSQQSADGCLGGRAGLFARMYCHAMATIAVGEAYGLTGDERLREPLRKAVAYSVAAQHPTTGGWRYEPWRAQPSERGDTSLLGWQLMALRSAELAGLSVPQKSKDGMSQFLRSVSSGTYGGLASYRMGENASRPMTAEALLCRLMLGQNQPTLIQEASDAILQDPPSGGISNMYYWYYATLALYQLQGESWQRWNAALKGTLLTTQIKRGDLAGSWDTNDTWGGHGGRIYTTAMAALCLEVYYRYLPLYGHTIAREPQNRTQR